MQCQRGFIDKAIEVNTQALKFCKDKNDKCKLELETQKTYLIEMKLKQSIERIEKGKIVFIILLCNFFKIIYKKFCFDCSLIKI